MKFLFNSDPPGTPQMSGFPAAPVVVGTNVNLKCTALPPGDSYDWFKGVTKITASLSYEFQVEKESAGIYTCVARNSAGSATSGAKKLVVYCKYRRKGRFGKSYLN